MINNVVLVGRAGNNPDIRFFESGRKKATIRMAVSKGKDKDPDWFEIIIWGKDGDKFDQVKIAQDFVKKGHMFGVVGELEQEKWTGDQGEKRSKVIVNCRSLRLLQPKEGTGDSAQSQQQNAMNALDAVFADEEIGF